MEVLIPFAIKYFYELGFSCFCLNENTKINSVWKINISPIKTEYFQIPGQIVVIFYWNLLLRRIKNYFHLLEYFGFTSCFAGPGH